MSTQEGMLKRQGDKTLEEKFMNALRDIEGAEDAVRIKASFGLITFRAKIASKNCD